MLHLLNINSGLFVIDGAAQRNNSNNYGSSDISTTPIAALSPYQNKYDKKNIQYLNIFIKKCKNMQRRKSMIAYV